MSNVNLVPELPTSRLRSKDTQSDMWVDLSCHHRLRARFERHNKCNDLRPFFTLSGVPKCENELTLLTSLDEGKGQL